MQIVIAVLNHKISYNSLSTENNFHEVLNDSNTRQIYNECVRIKSRLCKGHKYNLVLNKLMRVINNEFM